MTQTFSELLQDVYDTLGRQVSKGLIATGGSVSTIIDTTISDDYQDDDFLNYTAFVHRDAGGAGAAPQNEFQKVTAYNATTKTLSTGTFTTAIAAGDEILITKPSPFPLADVKRLCNLALRSLGTIRQYDTSITSDGSASYTLPDAIRVNPSRIWYLDGSDYYELHSWRVEEGAEGSDWTLVLPEEPTGTLKIEYKDIHKMLSLYNDAVSEAIPGPLASAVCAWYCAKWQAMNDETWLNKAAELRNLYETERMRNPQRMKPSRAQGMPHWYVDKSKYREDDE